jgi:hypothetical protein
MDLLTAVLQTILQQEPFCGELLIMRVQQKPLKSDVMVWDDIALDRKAKFFRLNYSKLRTTRTSRLTVQ